MAVREEEAGDEEPLVERERKAQSNDGASNVNVTASGRDIVGIEPGDTVCVRVFADRIEVLPKED